MRTILTVIALAIVLWPTNEVSTQERMSPEDIAQLSAVEDTLGLLGYAITNDSIDENRFGAVRAFIPKLVGALKVSNSFDYPFDQLKTISIQYPADSTFRVFTWQLYVDKDTYRYYGAIQMNTPDLKLFPLVDRSFDFNGNLEQATFSDKDWFGALYYNIHQVSVGAEDYYLLFGFDADDFFHKRKLVEVLTFVDGKPQFGAPVFLHENSRDTATKNRLVLEYSSAASVHCNYDPAIELLMFDHLTTVGGQYGEGPVQIPDGTYEGYRLDKGRWLYEEKVFHEILDEAPRPNPVLNGGGKNILGNGN